MRGWIRQSDADDRFIQHVVGSQSENLGPCGEHVGPGDGPASLPERERGPVHLDPVGHVAERIASLAAFLAEPDALGEFDFHGTSFEKFNVDPSLTRKAGPMLETLIVVLVILWLLGWLVFPVAGSLVHLLLVIILIVVVLRLVQGRRVL
jgi:hypothetical protein